MDSLSLEMMNSSAFDIANSMINSDITDAINLCHTSRNDVIGVDVDDVDDNDSEDDRCSFNHTNNIEYAVTNRLVVTVDDEESFNELVNHVTNGSNVLHDGSSSGGVSTRMRRRKATQPQRLIYCDLDFNLSEEQNFNVNNEINNRLLTDDSTQDTNNYSIEMRCEEQISEQISDQISEQISEQLSGESTPQEVVETITTPSDGKPKSSKGFECEICGSVWNSKTRLRSHYRTHGASKHLKCDICGKLFGWEYSWKTHMLAHSDDNPNRCPHCGLKLFNKTALSNHIKRIHDNPERPFKCNVCSKSFISKSELNQHSHVHNDDKPFMCEQCGKTFRSKSYLERHYRTHSGVKPFKCEFCGKLLADKTGFTAHIRSHIGERPFMCDICGKKYTIKRHLTSHMIIHSDLRPFKCEQCGKTFRSRTNFRMHKDSHLGIKRWSCKFCSRTFLSQGNMAKHVRRHIGERKHKCEVCGKAFIEKQELKNHSKMHASHQEKQVFKNCDESNEILFKEELQRSHSEVSTPSSSTDTNIDSANLSHFRDNLVNEHECNKLIGDHVNDSEDNVNNSVQCSAHTTLLTLASSCLPSLPSLASNLCLPSLSNGHALTTLNMVQTYPNVENGHNGHNMDNGSTLSFCDFQRNETSRTFYSNISTTRSPTPHSSPVSFFTSQSPVVSMPATQSQYINDIQHNYHCSLCSGVFVFVNNLREHLIEFHRVEPEKVLAMMY